MNNRATLRLSPEVLKDYLGVRDDVTIVASRVVFDNGAVELLVQSPTLPDVPENWNYPDVCIEDLFQQ